LARVEAVKRGKRLRLFTRRGHDWTNRFGDLTAALAALPAETFVLDGELVAEGPEIRPDFGLLQRAL
jgi:bifunctional non-homologous end joining protein LigD